MTREMAKVEREKLVFSFHSVFSVFNPPLNPPPNKPTVIGQIKCYLSHAPNTTGVDLAVKCLLTGTESMCRGTG
jgi:hypothetical protein